MADPGDDEVTFTGGSIPPFGCGYFTLRGVAERRAMLVFPLRVTDDEGAARDYTSEQLGDPYAAQLVYAGTVPEGTDGDDTAAWQVVLLAVFAVAWLVGAVVVVVRYAARLVS